MSRNSTQPAEMTQLQLLQTITTVYGEIAAMWMVRARDSIIRSRSFVDEVHQLFVTVFSAYTKQVKQLASRSQFKRGGKITFVSHNGKKVAVLLSANAGFYGEITKKTFEVFMKDIREHDYEATILGKQGLAMFIAEEPSRPHSYFEFSDEKVDQSQLLPLARHLVQYDEIRLYHGLFENFVTQVPVVDQLRADPYQYLQEQKEEDKLKPHIFEPNIEAILTFFEKQIFTSVLEQSVRESQLAKFASRIMVMDRAGENIRQRLKVIQRQQLKLTHRVNNQKQLNQFAGLLLWQGSS